MLSLKAPVLLVTNDVVLSGKFAKCNDALIKFSVSEEFAMFVFALFAQMFACKISCAIGNNPDSPRALNKVTITK
jgi:fructoselysine-6-P-deglycase FrlB-like protein